MRWDALRFDSRRRCQRHPWRRWLRRLLRRADD